MNYLDKLRYLRDKIVNGELKHGRELHIAILVSSIKQNNTVKEIIDSLSKVTTLVVYTSVASTDDFVQAYADSLGLRVRLLRPSVKGGEMYDDMLEECDMIFLSHLRLNNPIMKQPIYFRITDSREDIVPLNPSGGFADDDVAMYNNLEKFGAQLAKGEIKFKEDNLIQNPLHAIISDKKNKVDTDPLK